MSSNEDGKLAAKRKSLKLAGSNLFKMISSLNKKHEDDEDDSWGAITGNETNSPSSSPAKRKELSSSSSGGSGPSLASMLPPVDPPSPRGSGGSGGKMITFKTGSHTQVSAQATPSDASSEDNSPRSTPSTTPTQASPVASSALACSNEGSPANHGIRNSLSDDNLKSRLRSHTYGALTKSHSAVQALPLEHLNITSPAANVIVSPRAVVTEIHEDGIVLLSETNGYQRVRGGTLEKLVEKLTSDKFLDPNYLIEFLLTFRSFTTPQKLFSLLTGRYNITPPTDTDPEQMEKYTKTVLTPIRFRTLNVIRRWVMDQPKDFIEDEELRTSLLSFLDVVTKTGNEKLAITIRTTLDKKLSNEKEDIEVVTRIPTPRLPQGFAAGNYQIIDIPPEEIARQLTLIERNQFGAVDVPRECINQAWTKRESDAKSLNLTIEWFNKVSQWVCSEVVRQNKMDCRVKILEHMISLAECFLQLNNMNGLMEVISGLSKNPVHRLKGTWREISAKALKTFTRLDKLVSAENNYNEMRTHMKSLTPPCIPYLGLYLRDIVFIEDGNNDELPDSSYLNFEKRSMIGQVFRQIIEYQKTPYSLEPVENLQQFLVKSINEGLPEEELYHLSLEIVPRGGYTKGKKQKHDIEREREKEKEKSEREREKLENKDRRQTIAFSPSNNTNPYSKQRWKRDSPPSNSELLDVIDRSEVGHDEIDDRISNAVEARFKTLMEAQAATLDAIVQTQVSDLVEARLRSMVELAVASRLSSNPTTDPSPTHASPISISSSPPTTVVSHPLVRGNQPPSPRVLTPSPRTRFSGESKPYIINTDRQLIDQIDSIVQSSIDRHLEAAKQEIDAKLGVIQKQSQMMAEMWNGIVQLRHFVPETDFRKLLGLAQEMRKLSLPPSSSSTSPLSPHLPC